MRKLNIYMGVTYVMKQKIHIFTGHFGSGKTEVALNYAIKKRKEGYNVIIIDFDTVNPYFRTKDAEEILIDNGIRLIASKFASTNIDMPVIPEEIMSVFSSDSIIIFDIGGDEDGAYPLGQYSDFIKSHGYEMHLVVNLKRPLTSTAEDFIELIKKLERACRLRVTDIWNNTNIGYLTDVNTINSSYSEIRRLSELTLLPIGCVCGKRKLIENISDSYKKLKMDINIKPVFLRD